MMALYHFLILIFSSPQLRCSLFVSFLSQCERFSWSN